MALTPLSTILSRMDSFASVSTIEEQYKVRFLDDAIRTIRENTQLPWNTKKTTLRVFNDVLVYPTASDHDELAYLDNNEKTYGNRARFTTTSLQQFMEDASSRNKLTEVWDGGTKYLGINYKNNSNGNVLINTVSTVSNFTLSGDATAVALETVVTKNSTNSARITIVNSSGSSIISNSTTSLSDTNYKRKYYFRDVYLDAVPTSLQLRFGNDSSNYLTATVTTQFSGQSFKADDWNLVAFDLNTATEVGTINSNAFDYEAIVPVGAASGTYYLGDSYLRGWTLLDYWYYSKNSVATVGETTANQEYFYNSSDTYSTDSQLVGDSEWVNVVIYDAMTLALADKENTKIYPVILDRQTKAWEKLMMEYPSMKQNISTSRWNFQEDFNDAYEQA